MLKRIANYSLLGFLLAGALVALFVMLGWCPQVFVLIIALGLVVIGLCSWVVIHMFRQYIEEIERNDKRIEDDMAHFGR